jgi:hypothetical protein
MKAPRDEIRDEKFLVLMPASYRGRLEEASQGHIDPDAGALRRSRKAK